jgi:molybdopterin biosynthesis enzyme MoaB
VFNGVCDYAVTVSDDCNKITVRIFVHVSDDRSSAQDTLSQLNTTANIDLIVTTGGTGFAPRDVTPEVCVVCTRMMCARTQATLPLIARRAYGVEHALHTFCQRQTPMGALSRLVCGVTAEQRLIVNMPGSERAVKVCSE